ncbi:MAG TPA: hypothetical protein VH394_14975 [Thermoanaerobaculia bacterium]|jgi:hypothetical protein|nr:hypothetical protein [Thermoanaerobaculia bacterium]
MFLLSPVRRAVLGLLIAALLAPACVAQAPAATPGGDLVLHAYTMRYRQASDAISLVFPLLSQRGTVELQPATNTLVIRDSAAALGRIIPVLRSYDHPSRPLNLDIYIVRAIRSPGVTRSELPEELTRRMRALLPYDVYEVEAQAQLASREGQAVTYALGREYEVSFRLGTLVDRQRIRLSNFRVLRRTEERRAGSPLIHTNLLLTLEQTTSFGLARTEQSSEALMVVMTVHYATQANQKRPQAVQR